MPRVKSSRGEQVLNILRNSVNTLTELQQQTLLINNYGSGTAV
jgi:hypothetical protein